MKDLTRSFSLDMERNVFDAVVSMCTKRILLRLRLARSKRGAQNRSIQQGLRSAVQCLSELRMATSDPRYRLLSSFIQEAKLVIKLADDWVNHQTLVRLTELVDSIYRLRLAVDPEALFGGLTSRDMDPSSRKSLINIINKVARYREIGRYLYRLSKRKSLHHPIKFTAIGLPAEVYARPTEISATSTLEHVLARHQQSFRNKDITRICHLIDSKNHSANSQFANQVVKSLTKSKIHAEIQVIYYLELNPSSLPPRIIASSKDACFLCNAFIQMHGKMYTARTHGRLYPGWRLPFAPTLVGLEQRFNVLLESHVNAGLRTLLSRNRKTVYPNPNESTLLTLPLSASTLRSVPVAQGDAIMEESTMLVSNATNMETDNNDISIRCEEGLQNRSEDGSEEMLEQEFGDKPGSKPADSGANKAGDVITVNTSSRTSTTTSEITPGVSNSVEMTQGQSIVLKGNANFLAKAGERLHLHVEHQDQNAIMRGAERVTHSLEWLRDAEAVASKGTSVIDVEQMESEITHEVDDEGCVFIAARGVVVRIKAITNTL
jgi:hypothetical protein